jgi:hypothetical protein
METVVSTMKKESEIIICVTCSWEKAVSCFYVFCTNQWEQEHRKLVSVPCQILKLVWWLIYVVVDINN